jgi:preprotein translocase subunit SecG
MRARRMRRRLLNLFAFVFLAFAIYLTVFTKPESTPQQTRMKSVQGANGATASLHKAH